MKTINDIDVKNKTVLVRVDYNVPLQSGRVASPLRIEASLPTLKLLLKKGAKKIILISHLGRPEGIDKNLSLRPVAKALTELIQSDADFKKPNGQSAKAYFVDDVSGEKVKKAVMSLPDGDILLLENLRFYPGEKKNDTTFIKSIINAVRPDIFVQDGFAVVHRAHASTDAIKQFLPVYAGLLVEHEVKNLASAIQHPTHPVLVIIGGSKIDDKEPLINKFLPLADHIFVGGKIAADGYCASNPKIIVAEDFDEDSAGQKLDIGPLATAKLANLVTDAATIIWNGTLGYTEDPTYATASTITAELIGEKKDATTIICGGDTTGFVENLSRDHQNLEYSLISTGGGAALEFLLEKPLPGLLAIEQ